MSWRWDWDGGASEPFDTQDEAEAWLASGWRELLDDGVEEVRLTEDGEEVYVMALTEDG